jgi:hypothetical protein
MDASTLPGAGTGLAHNSIGFWRSFAQPVAMQAPVGGAAILTATMATITGGAGPLSFLLGIVCGVFLVLVFAELARHFASAGAVYAYAGLMAGVSFAFVIGWIYVLMMTAFWSGTLSATADFFNATLSTASSSAHVPWVLISIVTWVIVAYLVSRKIALSTAILFVLEVIGAALILSVGIVVFTKGGYGGDHFGFSYYFTFKGMSVNSAFLGVVIAFLGFGGFEGAAVFGEETQRPRRYLPRTMLASLLFSGIIYTYASWFENVGFKNSAALAASPSPLVQVTQMYVDKPIAVILGFAAVVSAFSAAVGSANAATRYLYALGRDGFLSRRLARDRTHPAVSDSRAGGARDPRAAPVDRLRLDQPGERLQLHRRGSRIPLHLHLPVHRHGVYLVFLPSPPVRVLAASGDLGRRYWLRLVGQPRSSAGLPLRHPSLHRHRLGVARRHHRRLQQLTAEPAPQRANFPDRSRHRRDGPSRSRWRARLMNSGDEPASYCHQACSLP